jgi:hypothetical protein
MILELIEEIKPDSGTMYVVVKDGLSLKWFVHIESAEAFYNSIIANPNILKPIKNILKSQEIDVPLEEQNN